MWRKAVLIAPRERMTLVTLQFWYSGLVDYCSKPLASDGSHQLVPLTWSQSKMCYKEMFCDHVHNSEDGFEFYPKYTSSGESHVASRNAHPKTRWMRAQKVKRTLRD